MVINVSFFIFQSTHPHGVRRCCLTPYIETPSISIHAPARGATRDLNRSSIGIELFQSTHPHGVRRPCRCDLDVPGYISIHAPARGATSVGTQDQGRIPISIHAPARGATLILLFHRQVYRDFNPRTRTGCDLNIAVSSTGLS